MVSQRKDKKGFTLIELILVIGVISFLLYTFSPVSLYTLSELAHKRTIKDFVTNKMLEIEGLSYNNVTVNQELLRGDRSINTEISRFRDGAGRLDNSDFNLAYYHSLYFTTNPQDQIDTSTIVPSNNFIYLLQYRQEGIQSLSPRTLIPSNFNPHSSPQLITIDNIRWSERYSYPMQRSYYLNKIVAWDSDCSATETIQWFQILYSVANLNFRFITPNGEERDFDYRLCYSQHPENFDIYRHFNFRVNRESLRELYFESIN